MYANSWEIVAQDETGVILNVNYTCPNCDYNTGEIVTVYDIAKINTGSFEIDMYCDICSTWTRVACV